MVLIKIYKAQLIPISEFDHQPPGKLLHQHNPTQKNLRRGPHMGIQLGIPDGPIFNPTAPRWSHF